MNQSTSAPKYEVGDKLKNRIYDHGFANTVLNVYESTLVEDKWEYDLKIDDCGSVHSKVPEEYIDREFIKVGHSDSMDESSPKYKVGDKIINTQLYNISHRRIYTIISIHKSTLDNESWEYDVRNVATKSNGEYVNVQRRFRESYINEYYVKVDELLE